MSIAARIDERPVLAVLDRLQAASEGLFAPLDDVGQALVSEMTGLFRTSQDPYGSPWPPSRRAGAGGKTLVDRGHLRDSLNHAVAGDSLTIGAAIAYARIHNEGFAGESVVQAHQRRITQAFGEQLRFPVFVNVRQHSRQMEMPQRQFVPTDGLPADWEALVIDTLQEHLVGAANG